MRKIETSTSGLVVGTISVTTTSSNLERVQDSLDSFLVLAKLLGYEVDIKRGTGHCRIEVYYNFKNEIKLLEGSIWFYYLYKNKNKSLDYVKTDGFGYINKIISRDKLNELADFCDEAAKKLKAN